AMPAAGEDQAAQQLAFRLEDATNGDANAPEWADLFVDGVANYLKGFHLAHAQISHDRAKELHAFIAENKASVGRFMGKVVREIPNTANNLGVVFGKKAASTDYAADAAAGNIVTDQEDAWLQAMIDDDGEIDAIEKRLIQRIAEEG
ncbi:MAG: hypothetical protein AAGL68_10500, partial [Pseudomonadota bacterium]